MKGTNYRWTANYRMLPEHDRICLPCIAELERIGGEKPGAKTWQCPNCEKKYSDNRVYHGQGTDRLYPPLKERAR